MVCAYILDTALQFNPHPTLPCQMRFNPPQCQLPNFNDSLKLLNGKFQQWGKLSYIHAILSNEMKSYTIIAILEVLRAIPLSEYSCQKHFCPHRLLHTCLGYQMGYWDSKISTPPSLCSRLWSLLNVIMIFLSLTCYRMHISYFKKLNLTVGKCGKT